MRSLRAVVVLAGVLALAASSSVVAAAPVGAAPAQTQCGNTAANPTLRVDRATLGSSETAVVTVTGTGYLLPPHVCGTDVFGGIYLFFGWVQPGDRWGPSHKTSTSTQGLFGTSYSYPGEGGGAETRDDGTGAIRLISFTAGGESGTSTPFHMDGAGNWQSNLTIRGATYSYTDLRTGASNSVDCRAVQCGVFTVGAHGKASRTNERFTPISFVDPSGAPAVPGAAASGSASGGSAPTPDAAANAAGAGVDSGATGGTTAAAGEDAAAPSTAGEAGSDSTAPSTTTTELEGADGDEEDVTTDDEVAAVQEFGGSERGGGGALVGAVLALVAVLTAAVIGVVVVRRRAAAAPLTDGVVS